MAATTSAQIVRAGTRAMCAEVVRVRLLKYGQIYDVGIGLRRLAVKWAGNKWFYFHQK